MNVIPSKNMKMINAGFVIGPTNKFKQLCKKMNSTIKDKNYFGPDQILLNYELYTKGFFRLGNQYNFIPATAKERLRIRKGVIYNKDGTQIPVVHNAGRIFLFRVIKNFGYGPKNNRLNKTTYYTLRTVFKILRIFNSRS